MTADLEMQMFDRKEGWLIWVCSLMVVPTNHPLIAIINRESTGTSIATEFLRVDHAWLMIILDPLK